MAGDWIKFEVATPDKPEVWAIAAALNIDPDAVVGKLLRVWAWFDQHTGNGNAPIEAKAMLDRLSGVAGFCDAVSKAGWLRIESDRLILPGFDKHNGKTAKQRINTARRVANHKARKRGGSDDGNAEVTQSLTGERACIPRPVRAAVYERDSHTCVYCGRAEGEYGAGETARDGLLSADHVIPVTKGGANSLENLVTCCLPCNSYKGDRTPDEAGLKWPRDNKGNRYGCVSSSVSKALPKEDKREDIDITDPNGSVVGAKAPPPCPHLEIIALYNEILPELPHAIPERWGGARAKHLQARWRESQKHQALDFWRRFFGELRKHPWYLGENDRGWKADLGWLVERGNFDKLIEKFVSARRAAA